MFPHVSYYTFIFIFRDASRAGELLVPKSGPKSALNPESALSVFKLLIILLMVLEFEIHVPRYVNFLDPPLFWVRKIFTKKRYSRSFIYLDTGLR